jgi:hypothetical protein
MYSCRFHGSSVVYAMLAIAAVPVVVINTTAAAFFATQPPLLPSIHRSVSSNRFLPYLDYSTVTTCSSECHIVPNYDLRCYDTHYAVVKRSCIVYYNTNDSDNEYEDNSEDNDGKEDEYEVDDEGNEIGETKLTSDEIRNIEIGMSKQFLCSEMIPSVAFAVKTSNCARRIVH